MGVKKAAVLALEIRVIQKLNDTQATQSLYFLLCLSGFRKNDEMKAMDVLPILKEKVAYLSGKV